MAERTHPIEGQIVLLAGARASVPLEHLSALLEHVHRHLIERRDSYERQYERIEAEETVYYLVDIDHWERVAADVGLDDSEIDAVQRAHDAQFRRDGRRLGRTEEFETTLEIRQPVVIA